MRKSIIAGALLAFTFCSAQQRNVLFIGNSYTYVNDLPNTFRLLALALGDTVNVFSSAPGGYTFQQHSTNAGTLSLIASLPWDFVVLQEQSQIPSFPQSQVADECYPFAAILVDSILANDACTQPVFYMTWGRQYGDAGNCAVWPPVCTYEGMQSQLRWSYLQMAEDNAAFCAPAGIAWQHVRETYPMLNLYNPDQSHPSIAGTYVVANAMYATLFRSSTVGASFTAGLAADTALFIQQIASSTVLDSLDTWNIGVNDPDAGFAMAPVPDVCQFQFTPNNGAGTHAWDFGDGTTSDAAAPAHNYDQSTAGLFVTHTITDDCGRSASTTAPLPECTVGMDNWTVEDRPHAMLDGRSLRLVHVPKGSTISVFDAAGRAIPTLRDALGAYVPAPTPFCIWRIVTPSGGSIHGKIVIP